MILRKCGIAIATFMLSMVLALTTVIPAYAYAPAKEEVDYEGNGIVDVEFTSNVTWKTPKVKVTDQNGKSYAVTVIKKDNDDISFRVKNFKSGTKYNFSISGVKKRGTASFGTVKGTFSIPKAKATVKKPAPAKVTTWKITNAKAKTTAVNNAVSKYKAVKSTMRDYDIEKDTYKGKKVWEISFEAKRTGKKAWYEFEYKVDASTGKILSTKVTID